MLGSSDALQQVTSLAPLCRGVPRRFASSPCLPWARCDGLKQRNFPSYGIRWFRRHAVTPKGMVLTVVRLLLLLE